MSGPYHTLRDHVLIRFDDGLYHISLTKEIAPARSRPVDCLYGRIWPILFPDDPILAGQHADYYPLDVDSISLECRDDAGRTLKWEINHRYSQYVEIRISFQDISTGEYVPVYPGQRRAITYSFKMDHLRWGPHVERRLVRKTDFFLVDLDFPANIIAVSGYIISGESKTPLLPEITYSSANGRDLWHWEKELPEWDDRYRVAWSFRDKREAQVRADFLAFLRRKAAAEESFRINARDRVLVWRGESHKVSELQIQCILYMHKKTLEGNKLIHQKNILSACRSDSDRLRDVFKHSQLLKSLIHSEGGGYYSLKV